MKTLLLAAGRSKRAKPIEDKNFLKFCGKYLIEHQLEALTKAGLTDISPVSNKLQNLSMQKFSNKRT